MKIAKKASIVSAMLILVASGWAQAAPCSLKLFLAPVNRTVYSRVSPASIDENSKVRSALAERGYTNIVSNQQEAEIILNLEAKTFLFDTGIGTDVSAAISDNGSLQKLTKSSSRLVERDFDYGSTGESITFVSIENQFNRAIESAIAKLSICSSLK